MSYRFVTPSHEVFRRQSRSGGRRSRGVRSARIVVNKLTSAQPNLRNVQSRCFAGALLLDAEPLLALLGELGSILASTRYGR